MIRVAFTLSLLTLPAQLLAIPPLPPPEPPPQPRHYAPVRPPPYMVPAPDALYFPRVPPAADARSDPLGDVWELKEISDWSAVWIRRGGTRLFDGYWTNPNGERVRAPLEIRHRGNEVIVVRRHTDGQYCRYDGHIAPDRVQVQGRYTCTWERTPMPWRAQIVRIRDAAPYILRDAM